VGRGRPRHRGVLTRKEAAKQHGITSSKRGRSTRATPLQLAAPEAVNIRTETLNVPSDPLELTTPAQRRIAASIDFIVAPPGKCIIAKAVHLPDVATCPE
jgi:hypothetical protein